MPGRPSNHQSPIICNYRQNTRLVNTGRKDFKPPGSQRVTAGMLLTAFLGQKEARSFHTREYFWLLEIPFRTQAICEIHTVALPAATWLRVQLLMTTDYKQKKLRSCQQGKAVALQHFYVTHCNAYSHDRMCTLAKFMKM